MGMMDGSLVLPSPLALEQARSFWVLLIVAGLSAVLSAYAWVLTMIKIAGGFYLLWLAYKAFKSAAAKHDMEAHVISVKDSKPLTYFLRGLAIQITNPKAALS
jgi:threonine/homoserine/homoserine lactone efflux protein